MCCELLISGFQVQVLGDSPPKLLSWQQLSTRWPCDPTAGVTLIVVPAADSPGQDSRLPKGFLQVMSQIAVSAGFLQPRARLRLMRWIIGVRTNALPLTHKT